MRRLSRPDRSAIIDGTGIWNAPDVVKLDVDCSKRGFWPPTEISLNVFARGFVHNPDVPTDGQFYQVSGQRETLPRGLKLSPMLLKQTGWQVASVSQMAQFLGLSSKPPEKSKPLPAILA